MYGKHRLRGRQQSLREIKNDFETEEEYKMSGTTGSLLIIAGALLIIAGIIFAFFKLWICTALLLVGAFGCFLAALNFKNRKDK